MLKGDLTSTPLAPLLLQLAADAATGCLCISDGKADDALVYLKSGLLYAVSVPGLRPQLGAKLVSSGALAPEALAEAQEAQQSELQGWRLGELLVHLGYVDEPVVEAFVTEQLHESLWDLLRWHEGQWRFRKNAKTREDVGPPLVVVDVLESLRDRGYEWENISAVVHGPTAVPMLSTNEGAAAETTLDNDAWSMLCKIDGERTVADLARDCGYTLFEAGQVIVSLVQAGLVDIEEHVDIEGNEPYGASLLGSALAGELIEAADEPERPLADDALSRLARVVSEVAGGPSETLGTDGGGSASHPPSQRGPEADDSYAMTVAVHRHSTESFAASIARVSSALSDVLGSSPAVADDFDPLLETRRVHRSSGTTQDSEGKRRRLRSAAAKELVIAQELAEALRPDRDLNSASLTADQPPRLVDLEVERARITALQAETVARHKSEDDERHAAEAAARAAAEEFARAAAEEAERAARKEAERLAREEADRIARAEAARIAAERAAAEEAARVAAEEAERIAAAEAERLAREEAERVAAEEAERLAAEEAERSAREDAERIAAERAAAEAAAWDEYRQREEAERQAAEAARLAAEEAERQAREEAARLAAEEAERLAAELAAEEEAKRLAAEEAARLAAEEAARLAAEEAERAAAVEAERLAREEAERLALEEAAIAAAAAEAEREARRKADKEAAEAAARQADEAAAATALLIELNNSASAVEEPEPNPEPEPEMAEAPPPEPELPEPPAAFPDIADTAALLRELSSLTIDDDPEAKSPASPRAPRPAAPDPKKVKKKIGLFGL